MPNTDVQAGAGLVEFYLADHLHVGRYVTLLGGERFSIYRAAISTSPRSIRASAQPSRFPACTGCCADSTATSSSPRRMQTVSSSVLNYASQLPEGQNTFTPLPSERDEEHQFGIQIPCRGGCSTWPTYRTASTTSSTTPTSANPTCIFPIAVDGALVRSWEMTLRSPQLARLGQFHLAYSNQIAEQRGAVTGGFTCSLSRRRGLHPAGIRV